MFYDKYVSYCNKAGIAPTTAAEEMGFSRSDATRWSKGSAPRRATLQRIASYFSAKLNLQLSYKEFENTPETQVARNSIDSKSLDEIHTPVIQKIVKICSEDPDAADDILLFAEALQRRNKK